MMGCQKSAPAQVALPTPSVEAAAIAAPSDAGGSRRVEISVTENGYEPSPITVKKGEPLTLVITRRTEKTCAKDFILDEHNIHAALPLNEPVTVTFTPTKEGELKYGCAMGKMLSGVFK